MIPRKKEVKIWQLIKDIDKKKQALMLSLIGQEKLL